ncbi:leucine rich repeat domain containing protein [Pseudohyphozyma bogoriensis]|nr:leucine rich repeat domain containing protein [Pseudohyphozyma bogoriensis]
MPPFKRTSSVVDPLSALGGSPWEPYAEGLELRKPKPISSVPPAPPASLYVEFIGGHPDEEKGRKIRSSSSSSSSASGPLFSTYSPPSPPSSSRSTSHAEASLAQGVKQADFDDHAFLDDWRKDFEQPAVSKQPLVHYATVSDPEEVIWRNALELAVLGEPVLLDNDGKPVNAEDKKKGKIDLDGKGLKSIPSTVAELNGVIHLPPLLEPPRTRSAPLLQFSSSSSPSSRPLNTRRSLNRTATAAPPSVPAVPPPTIASSAPQLTITLRNNLLTADSISFTLFSLKNLTLLSLHNNPLGRLPEGIGRCTRLETLNVANTKLEYLPAEILRLTNLKMLTIQQNSYLPPPSPPASSSDPAPANSRLLGPLIIHFRVPPLTELTARLLLSRNSSSNPSSEPLIKRESYLSEWIDTALFKPFLTTLKDPKSIHVGPGDQQPYDPLSNVCRSPAHEDERVFVKHAVERFEWVSESSLRSDGQGGGVRNIPIRHRGCSVGCLDWLEKSLDEEEEEH